MLGALSATVLVVGVAGCGGSGGSYANASRPPAPVSISVYVTDGRVAISPSRVGAGPVTLLIANESSRSHDVTLTAPAGGSGSCVVDDASSGPINPQGNARVQLPLVEGVCDVGVSDGRPPPARLVVGAARPSAQQDLMQP
jgi:hypothetical protein